MFRTMGSLIFVWLVANALGGCAPDRLTSTADRRLRPFRTDPPGTTLVHDSFLGTDGTNITAHTAETGQSWTLTGGFTDKVKIQNNTAQLSSGVDNNNWRIAIATDVAADSFELSTDYTRNPTEDPGDYVQLEFLAQSGSNPPQDRVYVVFTRTSSSM